MTKKELITEKCYECFVKNGIESTTTRDFCAAASVNANTLYYYFDSKTNILIECVNFGYRQFEDALLGAISGLDKSSFDFFPTLTKTGLDHAPQMRFLHQAISSPAYEKYREEQFRKVNAFYDRLGQELAKRLECPYGLIKDYVHEVMTLLSYFSLWGSREMAAIHFDRIFIDFRNSVTNYRTINSPS
jgi:AcrR family transcriptional regulator